MKKAEAVALLHSFFTGSMAGRPELRFLGSLAAGWNADLSKKERDQPMCEQHTAVRSLVQTWVSSAECEGGIDTAWTHSLPIAFDVAHALTHEESEAELDPIMAVVVTYIGALQAMCAEMLSIGQQDSVAAHAFKAMLQRLAENAEATSDSKEKPN